MVSQIREWGVKSATVNQHLLLHIKREVVYSDNMQPRYTIEVVATGEQTKYEGSVQDRLHVMQKLAQQFKSNIRLLAATPVSDGSGCVDYDVDIIHEVTYKS